MNVLALVAYKRPELLKIYFDQLLKEPDELKNYLVHIFLDYGFSPDALKVIQWFRKFHKNIKITQRTEQESKISPLPAFYNIMDSYRVTTHEADQFVILGEEDIIPTNDYLRFNRVCYEKFLSKYPRIFCVAHKRRPETELNGHIQLLIGDYQITSPSCISVETIKKYMIPEMEHPKFFSNPPEYNAIVHFNSKNQPKHHIHHDGQIERIAELHNMFSLKPDQARSMHIGVGGQHDIDNINKITGTLDEKIQKYYTLISQGSSELRKYVTNFKEDIVVTSLDNETWGKDIYKDLLLDDKRLLARASSWWYDPNNEFKDYINDSIRRRL